MPRQTSEDYDQHYYADRRRRDRDDCYDKYSTSHQMTHNRERYYKDSSSDRAMQKYSRARSRSRSISRSRHSKKSSRRSRSRSKSRYDYSDRRRSKSRSYSDRKRSRSKSYSKRSKRSRSRNSSKHKHRRRSIERNTRRSNTPLKHTLESSNLKDKNMKDLRNSEPDIQRYTEFYSTVNTMSYDGNKYDTYNYNDDNNLDLEPFDKEKIHKEIEEKLRATLAKEGKVYPPRKTEASHPIFANDGSFLEVFKKMQEQVNNSNQKPEKDEKTRTITSVPAVSKRRGGRILKTGVVAKPTTRNPDNSDPKDFWALYLEEVKKYKNATCDIDGKTRPLVK